MWGAQALFFRLAAPGGSYKLPHKKLVSSNAPLATLTIVISCSNPPLRPVELLLSRSTSRDSPTPNGSNRAPDWPAHFETIAKRFLAKLPNATFARGFHRLKVKDRLGTLAKNSIIPPFSAGIPHFLPALDVTACRNPDAAGRAFMPHFALLEFGRILFLNHRPTHKAT